MYTYSAWSILSVRGTEHYVCRSPYSDMHHWLSSIIYCSLGADGHLGVLQNTVGHKSVEGPVIHGTMPSGFVIVKMPTDAVPPATAVPSEALLAQLRVRKPSQR